MIFNDCAPVTRVSLRLPVLASGALAAGAWLAAPSPIGLPSASLIALTTTLMVWPVLYRWGARLPDRGENRVLLVTTGLAAIAFMVAERPWWTAGALGLGALALLANNERRARSRRSIRRAGSVFGGATGRA